MLARPGTDVETKPGMAGQRGGPCGWVRRWCAEAEAEAWGGLRSDPALAAAESQLAKACATLGSTQALLLDYPLTQAHPTVPLIITQVSPANHFLVTPLLPQTAVG